ncbi:DUF423 domain-containing protein [Sansalvadorimonas verongulae]|uniref:DUF423 domain-containing protein n=1 Tax=Sansalvadorimonas verongulae TaxID=2172824 RepID=UPI0012BBFD6C|nr:DUF423 domain-containing protein [Sansalvadorimonas verongulae]MTI15307.1 DUF423 domain-containing protein [Sansalvadorimonas verongulae]
MGRSFLITAAISGFLVVALGAFGAHALAASFSAYQLNIWDKAVNYQMFHTVALGLVAVLALFSSDKPNRTLLWAGRFFTTGIVLFSGSLYLLAITEIRKLGMVTPLGGVAFLLGWLTILWHGIRITPYNARP